MPEEFRLHDDLDDEDMQRLSRILTEQGVENEIAMSFCSKKLRLGTGDEDE